MPHNNSNFETDKGFALYAFQSEQERRRAAHAQIPPPNKRPASTMNSSAKRVWVESTPKVLGISFGSTNQVSNPDLQEQLRIVRRAAEVAAFDQLLNDHVPDREANASKVLQNTTVVAPAAIGSLQERVKMEQVSGQHMGTDDTIDIDAKGLTKENDEEQASVSIQAPQSDTDLDAWAHQGWTTYFRHPPDPWWYDRVWRDWH